MSEEDEREQLEMEEEESEEDEEDEEEELDYSLSGGPIRCRRNSATNTNTDKRAHHNALERKRRDHIKDSFCSLRDAIPAMQGDKSSRAQILKKASEYITHMRRKNLHHQKDIEDLKRQNQHLERQIRALERAKSSGDYVSSADVLLEHGLQDDASTLVSTSSPLATAALTTPRNVNSDDALNSSGPNNSYYYSNHCIDDGGSDNSDTSTSSRRIAPGQSLLLNTSEQPPRKRTKS